METSPEEKKSRFSAGPVVNSSKSSKGEKKDTDSQLVSIPLSALIFKKRKIFVDASAINSNGFGCFVEKNSKFFNVNRKPLLITGFERRYISENVECIDRLAENYDKVGDYPTLIAELSKSKSERGTYCFIVNSRKKFVTILDAAKKSKLFIQLFHIDDQGELRSGIMPFVPKPEKKSRSEKENNHETTKKRKKFTITTIPERISISSLRAHIVKGTQSIVVDSKGSRYVLGNVEIVHSNAKTYSTDVSGVWAKIYNPGNVNTFLVEKLKRMLGCDIKNRGLCWPLDILCDVDGNFAGILVPEAKGEPIHIAIFKQAKLQHLFPNWNKIDLCDLALTILEQIRFLHDRNVLLGCINPATIRVVSKNEVYFLDADNYQIEGFPTLIYNATFTPPELHGRKIYLYTKEDENYAVAMLLFMLMMTGKTPYAMDPGMTADAAIERRQFAFPNREVHGNHSMPSRWRFMWSHLSPFKDLFYNTFQKGGKFEQPANRRDVSAWIGTLRYFKSQLEKPFDLQSLQLYPKSFKRSADEPFYRCSRCGNEYPKFYFDKRYFTRFKICNECIGKRSDEGFTCQACKKKFYYTNRTALFHQTMHEKDSDWRSQKYCSDCKKMTVACTDCKEQTPYYKIKNGRCPECQERYRNSTYEQYKCCDCGLTFNVSVGEHEYFVSKGFKDPVRCPNCRKNR
ncbi:zinc-ribbon domain containing protein [Bacteroides acidifaciens]|uniref:zinc-ribbon domain containing protein n=1 Tax=Bacteroides acidifaciens TaxID=85831 RepID=UPI00262DF213|nr:zinc-ribbon domain containing protein [Bacteroides acidifaciens]